MAANAIPLERRAPAPVINKCSGKRLALTFDDGPHIYTYKLASMLHSKGVKATFFINGDNYHKLTDPAPSGGTYADVLKHSYNLGHQIASHTYRHKNLDKLSESQVREEMNSNSDAINAAIGRRPAFMRPPEGAYNGDTLNILGQLGYTVVIWDIDVQDWTSNTLSKQQDIYREALESGSGGHIALQHDVYQQTAEELAPWIVDYAQSEGYEFVTVAECAGTSAYH
ncbi:hypothetical protein BDA99DRAFT_430008 [Phascolomyces articulosus]|uniref:NodB homology domain-containing protein n=1 Tax=Phascolomyces articulosus TaxID=60185 RepID=A0AAD5KP11_9FUNG|nr:hypothetical protein BDA99DRAFT_430008 [Phascolomyces articulosus]